MSVYTPKQREKLRAVDDLMNNSAYQLSLAGKTLNELNSAAFSATVKEIKETIGDLMIAREIIKDAIDS